MNFILSHPYRKLTSEPLIQHERSREDLIDLEENVEKVKKELKIIEQALGKY